ncbi:hypothetical protein PQE75_gp078 [Bacillus phage vB_BcoS-136]|uniref:Uncharacterized protein n=1 Tax=Bacillus phage vB_BcoS-136 TaxID=2419619 RepID=A0A3G3BVP7_9CAUD|nr:hypothetical protein PQE75_gp078 [Bacillus phage vB_BcoS-136]AYP68210.1 hypothetical protein vBBcoS136_00078 [Bacillus phage vB_BcoS-136]
MDARNLYSGNGNIIYIIDANMDMVTIHRIDTMNGKYLLSRVFRGDKTKKIRDYVLDVVDSIVKDRPYQIIFDSYGVGKGISDYFFGVSMHDYFTFKVRNNGVIDYYTKGDVIE